MKVVLHGGASYPFFFRDLVVEAHQKHPDIEWDLIVLSWRHAEAVKSYLAADHIFYVHPDVNKAFDEGFHQDELSSYSGSLYESIAVDKGEPGQLRTKSKEYQLRNAAAYYKVYKSYLQSIKPDVVFIPIIETHDSMIFYKVAKELGIEILIFASARNLGVSYFSRTPNEELPAHAFREQPSMDVIHTAQAFVDAFQKNPVPAIPQKADPLPNDLLSYPPRLPWSKNFFQRLPSALRDLKKDLELEPHSNRLHPFWYQPRIQFTKLRKWIYKTRGQLHEKYFELKSVEALPPKFIYFPLQVSPESSINALAPFFVDQERAVDMILYHIPSDYQLVIKEHPQMKGERSPAFYKMLQSKPGVLLADWKVSSNELIRRAALTVTVTGTAAFESLLLGKPSFVLGKTFFSPWVPTFDSFAGLATALQETMKQEPRSIQKKAVDCVSHILPCGYNFTLSDPYETWGSPQHTMNKSNLNRFLEAFLDHVRRCGINPSH